MSILNSLVQPITSLLDKVIEDKDTKNNIAFELATMAERHAQELAKGQLEVNKVEAAHKSLFVSGWRPAIGWICGLALLYSTNKQIQEYRISGFKKESRFQILTVY